MAVPRFQQSFPRSVVYYSIEAGHICIEDVVRLSVYHFCRFETTMSDETSRRSLVSHCVRLEREVTDPVPGWPVGSDLSGVLDQEAGCDP